MNRILSPRPAAAGLALALLSGPLAAQILDDPRLSVEALLPNFSLNLPTSMAFLDRDDILVLEKGGDVMRVIGGVLQPTPVLSVQVNDDSERGLLGIAINTEDPPKVFLYYTQASPLANRVVRYDWNPLSGQLENPQPVLDLPATPGPNHDGGVLVLGPPPTAGPELGLPGDGAPLFAVIGDLNRDGQLENFPAGAPPDDTAVILRVDQNGSPYPGNPFTPYCQGDTAQTCAADPDCGADGPCVTRVARYWAYGVRNSFGLGLDPVTGALWDSENGPGTMDEVNRVPIGINSGWEQIMGPDERDPQDPDDLWDMPGEGSTYSDPEFSWLDTNAPTGILFPVGSTLGSDYDDVALVADNNRGQIYALPLNGLRTAFDLSAFPPLLDLVADNNAEADLLRFARDLSATTDLELGPDGDLYAVSIGRGTIYRISGQLFADGFESGDTSAWDAEAQ